MTLSRIYSRVVQVLSGCRLKDIHGSVIYPVAAVRELQLSADGYTFQLEAITKLLRRGTVYAEHPVRLNPDKYVRSQALRLRTVIHLSKTLWSLFIAPKRGRGRNA